LCHCFPELWLNLKFNEHYTYHNSLCEAISA
jgi:hypothetical protein